MKKFVSVGMALGIVVIMLMPSTALARGSATVVVEAESGRVLYASGERVRLPMASTTKIMTALLALEQPDIDRQFVVDDTAIMVEGSSMGLCKGDTASLRALAGGMLTASGNDAANATAHEISGGNEQFAVLMNERARAIGMSDTRFVTPSGLHDDNHYSTAYDMAMLAREALQNPLFLEMCSSKRLTLNFGNPPYDRTLYNHNRLLSLYPAAIGVKTGFTREAGRCLVSAARKGDVTLIVVTLGVGDDWNVHQSLYNRYFGEVARVSLPPPDGLAVPIAGGNGKPMPLSAVGEMTAVAIGGELPDYRTEVFAPQFLYLPIKKGDIVGKIVYYIDNEPAGELPLAATVGIAPPSSVPPSMSERLGDWLWELTG